MKCLIKGFSVLDLRPGKPTTAGVRGERWALGGGSVYLFSDQQDPQQVATSLVVPLR